MFRLLRVITRDKLFWLNKYINVLIILFLIIYILVMQSNTIHRSYIYYISILSVHNVCKCIVDQINILGRYLYVYSIDLTIHRFA